MKMKDIHTVVLHSLVGDEDSTASFERFEDAIDYIISEELSGQGATEREMKNCRKELEECRTYEYGNWEYTIYDAKLVLAPTAE